MESRLTDADSCSTTQSNKNCGVKSLRNISVQTGEEFLDEFLRDRVASRKVPIANDADQIPSSKPGFEVGQNYHITGLRGSNKRETESCPDYIDYSSGNGYGLDVNSKTYVDGSSAYYRELQPNGQPRRMFSENFDRGGPSAVPVYSSESPLSSKMGSGVLDGSLSGKLKFLCSFGGKILPRPNDGKLRYVGGDTRIISLWKSVTYLELLKKTMAICNYHHTIKYQLPGEDLDALISVSSDEDLHHMIDEYHDLEKISQRLRLFLVASGDLEGPYSSEGRTIQQGDADYPYVVAVNAPQRSFSRESLESQWVNNVDSPTLQMEPPTPFRHLENQSGSGLLNTAWTMTSPSSQVFNTPQVPPTAYVPSSHLAHVQFSDPSGSYMKGYEDIHSPYAYTNNCAYLMDSPANDNTCCFDGSGYYQNHLVDTLPMMDSSNQNSRMVPAHTTPPVGSHYMPSKDCQPHSPYAPSFADANIGFPSVPLHSEKLVPSQDTYGLAPVTGVHANSYWIETKFIPEPQPTNEEGPSESVEQEMEQTSWALAAEKLPSLEMSGSSREVVEEQKAREKDQISRNKDQVFHETATLNKDFIEWGEDTIKSMKNGEASFDQDKESYALNADFYEQRTNLPQLICRPGSQLSQHVPKSELQVNGSKNSSSSFNSAEYPEDFWKELSGKGQINSNEPEFLIKSQQGNSDLKHLANATDSSTAIFASNVLQPVLAKGNNQSKLLIPVLLPDKAGVGLCLADHLIFPETTSNALDGEKLTTSSHESVKKEKPNRNPPDDLNMRNGTFVNSQYPDNCHKPGILKDPTKVEDVADNLQHEVPSSTNAAHRPDEHVESPGDTPGAESHLTEFDDYV